MVPTLSTREAFLQSFIHQRYFLFGRELLPFCLRHYLLLSALDSPLLYGRNGDISDLRLAALVCSTASTREFFEAATDKSWKQVAAECLAALSIKHTYSLVKQRIYWQSWKKLTRDAHVTNSLRAFNNYVDDYLPVFPYWPSDEQGEATKIPPAFISAARFLIASGSSPEQVLNMPLGELRAWNYAFNEAQGVGNKDLIDDDYMELMRTDPRYAEGI